ncbi:MAG: nucleoside recognition domain-containing protein, partial [Actinomycetota bacterium]|nr:nucleoside recognition domain-containing protein [Actinomycetota bacterium]
SGGFADTEIEDSAFGVISKGVAPTLEPLGFGDWEQAGSLLSGFVAKEVVVSTMAQLYAVDGSTAEPASSGFLDDLGEVGSRFIQAGGDTLRTIPAVVGLDFIDIEDQVPTAMETAVRSSFDESSNGNGRLAALAFMVFVLLYTPCLAAVGAFRQEFGTRWMWVSVIGQSVIAWLGAFVVYQGGRLVGLG